MSREMTIGAYNTVRKALLTVWSTGEVVKNPWFLQGLDADGEYSKKSMMDLCISQVYMLRAHYNEGGFVHLTLKRAVAKVKHIIYYSAKKKLEADMHSGPQKKYEMIEHLFRVQLGEEEAWWTKRLIKVSDCVVYNYEGDEDIFSKFTKRADGWYTYGWTTKFKYVDPDRTRYLKSGKQERFNILENRIGSMENEWVNDCMLWEHLVDCYASYKVPYQASYGEIMLACNNSKGASYSKDTALRRLRDFFLKAFSYYGINIKKEDATFHRDISGMLDVYGTLDMLLKERKRGYSVADVLNR